MTDKKPREFWLYETGFSAGEHCSEYAVYYDYECVKLDENEKDVIHVREVVEGEHGVCPYEELAIKYKMLCEALAEAVEKEVGKERHKCCLYDWCESHGPCELHKALAKYRKVVGEK